LTSRIIVANIKLKQVFNILGYWVQGHPPEINKMIKYELCHDHSYGI